jgi:hypothetical protein
MAPSQSSAWHTAGKRSLPEVHCASVSDTALGLFVRWLLRIYFAMLVWLVKQGKEQ